MRAEGSGFWERVPSTGISSVGFKGCRFRVLVI